MPAKLTVLRGRQAGTELALEGKNVFDVGSSPGPAGWKLEGAGVAANHMRVFREEKKFTVFDLCGQGITVNGKKVPHAVLQDGDEVGVGSVTLRFVGQDASQYATLSPVAAGAAAPQGLSRPASERVDAPALLYCLEGTDKGKVWPLPASREKFTMGRGVSADVVVMDIKCSREHCRLERRGADYVVVDLGSTNGTKVNGVKMKPSSTQALKWGDQVRVGYSTLELRAAAAAGATAPTAKLGNPDQVAKTPPIRQAAPLPPPRPAQQPAASAKRELDDITFDFGPPPPVKLPARPAPPVHAETDDEEEGKEALRTFVFEDQPGEFAPTVDRTRETDEPPLDDYAAAPAARSAPPPPPPPPPPSAKPKKDEKKKPEKPKVEDEAIRTFVFDDAPDFEEKKVDKKSEAVRTFVFDEALDFEEAKKAADEPPPKEEDAAIRTFVFEEAPDFDDAPKKAPPPPPAPRKAKKTDNEIRPPEFRTQILGDDGTEKKPDDEEPPDPTLRTFVFDNPPEF